MAPTQPKNIAIVGGSLGGLFIGVALKRLHRNLNIRIFERNPTPLLHDQGAGVVAGPETQDFFHKHDRTKTPLSVTSRQRIYLDKEGNVIDSENSTQQMTSWDLLYHVLRANFDGVESAYAEAPEEEDGDQGTTTSYEYGCTVTDVSTPPSSPTTPLDFSHPIKFKVKHSTTSPTEEEADLLIAADGPSSTLRTTFFPNTTPRTYAGYVAWRGTISESSLSPSAAAAFTEKFTFFHGAGTQILAYLIPGAHGTLEPGQRLVNWVWYCNYVEGSDAYVELMTDAQGKRHHVTLPAGGVRDEVWTAQKRRAEETLPPQFAEIVNKTQTPFVQGITDVLAPGAVVGGGRVVLVGDALAGWRPHTAGSTGQAAWDAGGLAEVVERVIEGAGKEAVDEWGERVLGYAREGVEKGKRLGERSQFGVHPLRG